MRRLHDTLLLLALGSQILLGAAGSSFVLCTEADGELVLEWGFAGCCEPSSPAAPGAGEVWTSPSMGDCGDCADGAYDLSLQRDDGVFVSVVAVSPTLVLRQPVAARVTFSESFRAARAPPGLASLRTVNLRC